MISGENRLIEARARLRESLYDLYEIGGVELAATAARDFVCRHADEYDDAQGDAVKLP